MLILGIRFVAGARYHATPWDAHVNEGRIEWPPCPWRLLRMLRAAWELRGERPGMPSRASMRELVTRLSEAPPLYLLPERGLVASHTRHYYLVEDKSKGPKSKCLFDAFLDVGVPRMDGWRLRCRGRGGDEAPWHLVVCWPRLELSEERATALDRLLAEVNYLGRAESLSLAELALIEPWGEPQRRWCEQWAAGSPPSEGPDGAFLSVALDGEGGAPSPSPRDGRETVSTRLLAAEPAERFAAWLVARREEAAAAGARRPGRSRGRRKNEQREAAFDGLEDLWDALGVQTDAWREQGFPRPPGSRWLHYVVPRIESSVRMQPKRAIESAAGSPVVARFVLSGPVLPSLRDAVLEADKLRRKLMGRSRGPDGLPSPAFSGKDEAGSPLRGHRHAFFLAEACEWPRAHGRITHLNVLAPAGFDPKAEQALGGHLGNLWQRGGHDVRLVLQGIGTPQELAAEAPSDVERGLSPLLASSRCWQSRTPFVPTLHPKRTPRPAPFLLALPDELLAPPCDEPGCPCRTGERLRSELGRPLRVGHPLRGSAEHDLLRQMRARGVPLPRAMQRLGGTLLGAKRVRWLHFRRERRDGGGVRSTSRGFGYHIEFQEPVRGPLAFGYGAHFGLGLFVPAWTGWGVEDARDLAPHEERVRSGAP